LIGSKFFAVSVLNHTDSNFFIEIICLTIAITGGNNELSDDKKNDGGKPVMLIVPKKFTGKIGLSR
jgi:hypothetical protein